MKTKVKSFRNRILSILLALILVGGGGLLYFKLEGGLPELSMSGLTPAIRASHEIIVHAADAESGLRSVVVVLEKDGRETVLAENFYPPENLVKGGRVKKKNLRVTVNPEALGVNDGRAIFRVVAADYSWRNWLNGNRIVFEKDILVDTHPPEIEILTRQHNINQGGAGLLVYRLSEDCPESGVQVGDNVFPGHPAARLKQAAGADIHVCLFALSHLQGTETSLAAVATDNAGNTSRAGFHHLIKPAKFRNDTINISDRFLNAKMPEFAKDLAPFAKEATAPTIETFLLVNRKLRTANTETMKSIAAESEHDFLWQDAFLRLPNAARMASFADHRTYRYLDETVDQQYHMGIDLASTRNASVPAANSGKVAYADHVGIYGGTVMIDHGFGLFSIYSHLNQLFVKVGQPVSKGETIGTTGTTGLAGGDHLHFGMMVHNTFVNPVEWWDIHWIRHNITDKLQQAVQMAVASQSGNAND